MVCEIAQYNLLLWLHVEWRTTLAQWVRTETYKIRMKLHFPPEDLFTGQPSASCLNALSRQQSDIGFGRVWKQYNLWICVDFGFNLALGWCVWWILCYFQWFFFSSVCLFSISSAIFLLFRHIFYVFAFSNANNFDWFPEKAEMTKIDDICRKVKEKLFAFLSLFLLFAFLLTFPTFPHFPLKISRFANSSTPLILYIFQNVLTK